MDVPTTRATLLARLRDNADATAWGEFHERYRELIISVAKRWGLQNADCEDVLQDVMTRVSGAMQGFDYDPGAGRFRGYLKTIATNTIISRLRQKTVARGVGGGGAPEVPDGAAIDEVWDAEWRRHHARTALRRALSEAGDRDRIAFERYAVRGADVRAVAESLEMSVDQVYQVKSRIMKRIAALVAEQVDEEEGR